MADLTARLIDYVVFPHPFQSFPFVTVLIISDGWLFLVTIGGSVYLL